MPDDFEALRTIRAPLGDLDAERAARMRARALATVLQDDQPPGSILLDDPAPPARSGAWGDERGERDDRDDVPLTLLPAAGAGHGWTPDGRGRPVPKRHGTRRSFVVVVAAAAAVLAVVIGLSATRSREDVAVVADQPEPTSVADLAANAATLVDRPLRPGEFAHIRTQQADPVAGDDGTPQIQVRTREEWANTAGAGRERSSDTQILDIQRRTLGTLEPGRVDDYDANVPAFGSFGYDSLRALPPDPDRLRAALNDGTFGPPNEDATRYRLIGELLVLDSTSPGVRSAALAILAADGATLVDDVTDPAGHTGIGILAPRDDGETTVFVVTRDGFLLGTYDIATGDPVVPESATGWTTLEAQDRVTSVG